MKKYLTSLVTLLAFTSNVFAQTVIPNNTVTIGKTGSANKTIEFNLTKAGASANPKLRYNPTTSKIEKADDGVNFVAVGSGSDAGNRLSNGNYETSTTGWTASGGTLSTTTTAANVYEGVASGTWDSNAASQTLTSAAVTVGGLAGTNGEMTCYIQTPSGTATHTMGIWDGSSLTQTVTITSSTNYTATTINFTYPSSGTVAVRLTSVNADEPQINHECYIGPTRNITSGVIVTPWTTVSGITITGTTTNPTKGTTSVDRVMWRRVGSNAEIRYEYVQTGAGTAGSGDYLIALPSGLNIDSTKVSFFTTVIGATYSTENNSIGFAKMGAISNGVMSVVAYDATRVRLMGVASTPSAGTMGSSYYALSNASVSFNITMSVPIAGWATGSAVNADQTDFGWTPFTPTGSWVTNTTYSGKYRRFGETMEIQYYLVLSGAPTATPLTLNIPTGYTIDSSKVFTNTSTNSVGLGTGIARDDGTNSYTVHAAYIPSTTSIGILTTGSPVATVSNTSPFTFGNLDSVLVTVSVPIVGWSSNQRAPTLVGSITSNAQNAERLERAFVSTSCTSSPCTISSGNGGSWLTNITRAGAGSYSANFVAGTFSSAPSCFAWNFTANRYMIGVGTATTSAFTFSTSDSADTNFSIMCMGPR